VVHTRPRRPTEIAPHLPAAVDHVLAIGLARRPQDRFGAAVDFAAAMVDALEGSLPPAIRSRGEALLRHGAWDSSPRAKMLAGVARTG